MLNSIQSLLKNTWFYLVLFLASAVVTTGQAVEPNWEKFVGLVSSFFIELLPIIFFKWYWVKKHKHFWLWWSLCLVVYPVLLVAASFWFVDSITTAAWMLGCVWLWEALTFMNEKLGVNRIINRILHLPPWPVIFLCNLALFSFLMYQAEIPIFHSKQLLLPVILALSVTILFWINKRLLVNRVLDQHGFSHYFVGTLLLSLILGPVIAQIIIQSSQYRIEPSVLFADNYHPFQLEHVFVVLCLLWGSLPIILLLQWQRKHRQVNELEKEKLHTELMFLQQQINPHFLFNTLNNLYALTLSQSEKAPDMVQNLANLLRFVVYKGRQDKVSLQEEIEYLNDYLELQRLRVSNKCTFDIEFEHCNEALTITPLMLIILVENAFKHGIEPAAKNAWLRIKITVVDQELRFYCANSKVSSSNVLNGGVGTENLKRRLRLLYPGKHKLQVDEDKNSYHVTLVLELTNDD